jgi:cytochrome c-type biogenesis protein CcmH
VSTSRGFRRASWLVIFVLAVVALAVATFDEGAARTTEEQVERIASTLKCPTCDGQSVADSDSAASRAIRLQIAELVEEGRSAAEVRAAVSAAYGDDVQLVPPASGVGGLVWIVPVVVLIAALAGVAAAFARWRRQPRTVPSDDDRVLVEQARQER